MDKKIQLIPSAIITSFLQGKEPALYLPHVNALRLLFSLPDTRQWFPGECSQVFSFHADPAEKKTVLTSLNSIRSL